MKTAKIYHLVVILSALFITISASESNTNALLPQDPSAFRHVYLQHSCNEFTIQGTYQGPCVSVMITSSQNLSQVSSELLAKEIMAMHSKAMKSYGTMDTKTVHNDASDAMHIHTTAAKDKDKASAPIDEDEGSCGCLQWFLSIFCCKRLRS